MNPISYEDSGVSIDEQDRFIERIKAINPDIGGFSGVFPLPLKGMTEPCLVAGTDGVGTKLLVAEMTDRYDTIGIDLVAMVVNDLICCGARPLFFLDYYATGKLSADHATKVLKGIVEGCRQSNCQLVGGETAELPGLYSGKHFDLAGFGVGVVDRSKVIDGARVQAGDAIIGLLSSGIHSNGLSLARKVLFEKMGLTATDSHPELQGSVADNLLTPTRIYVGPALMLAEEFDVRSIAHITGGGLLDNLPRVLPKGVQARIDTSAWQVPALFQLIGREGPVERREMFRTFNMGVGLVLIVPAAQASAAVKRAGELGCPAVQIGEIAAGERCVRLD
ncbi:phosphoribosylformylglycinamidine cyclo-ligase [Candidatus Sumerlaeota bacterium]|nr:phosphoribosylformylglycinamidine cyclo-ligase [Candidatus Sumerlaeota bacterium]